MIRSLRGQAVLLTLVLGLATLLAGCGTPAATMQPRIVITLLDVSGSTAAVRDNYLAEVKQIVDNVPAGARLVVLPVSSRSLTSPALLDISFPENTWWKTNSFTYGREVKRLRQQAMETVSTPHNQDPGRNGTAIIDSLVQVQEYLKPYAPGSGALYIISDMVEQSDLLDLYDLDGTAIQSALAKVSKSGRMPALRGAAVDVAGLEASGHLPSDRVMAIRSFWEHLFQTADARLVRYSPALRL
ncbi:MAG: hypothetical protein JWN15_1571 [Firmicutes bacterium]|nr:hypothetical protein [Bacillota bacterium]